jgi:hypothetical protein
VQFFAVLVSRYFIFTEGIFHFYRADFSFLTSVFSIYTERVFYFS